MLNNPLLWSRVFPKIIPFKKAKFSGLSQKNANANQTNPQYQYHRLFSVFSASFSANT